MEETQNDNSIKERVLEDIQSGKIIMRPRWHFILKATLLATGIILAFLTLLYLISFIIFSLRQTGLFFVPIFGSRGWFSFFRSLPWVLVSFSLLFIIVLEILVRRYSFAHRRPLLYSILGILVLVLVGGTFAAPWQERFFGSIKDSDIPIIGPFYRNFGMEYFDDVHRGIVVAVAPDGSFVLQEMRGATSTVFITQDTLFPSRTSFQIGDIVVVLGDEMHHQIQAFGIQPIQP